MASKHAHVAQLFALVTVGEHVHRENKVEQRRIITTLKLIPFLNFEHMLLPINSVINLLKFVF